MKRLTPIDEEIDKLHKSINSAPVAKMVKRFRVFAKRDRDGGSAEPDGFPPLAPGSTVSSGGSTSDVHLTAVEAAADVVFPLEIEAPSAKHPDGVYRRRKDRDEYRTHVIRAWEHFERADRELAMFAAELDKLEGLSVGGTDEPPGCESCRRLKNSKGDPWWSAVYEKLFSKVHPDRPPSPSNVGGRLKSPMLLCRDCYDLVGVLGRLPTPKEVEARHNGTLKLKAS